MQPQKTRSTSPLAPYSSQSSNEVPHLFDLEVSQKMLKTTLRGQLSHSVAQQHQTRSQTSRTQSTCRPMRQSPIMCSTEREDLIQYSPQRIIEARKLPSQAETIFNSGETVETLLSRVPVLTQSPTQRSVSDLDYLSVSARDSASQRQNKQGQTGSPDHLQYMLPSAQSSNGSLCTGITGHPAE